MLDRIVAVVESEIILLSELDFTLQQAIAQMGLDPARDEEKIARLKAELLDNMIDEKILLVKAKEDTIQVKDSEIERTMETRLQQNVERYGSEEAFNRELQKYGLTYKDLKKRFWQEIQNELLAQKVMQSRISEIDVSRREIENFFQTYQDSLPERQEAVHLAHLLMEIQPGEEVKAKALERIQSILAEARAGTDFAELAVKYSECPSGPSGGDLGFFGPGTMVPEFETPAFALNAGQISEPVETPFGYHIIKMEEKKDDQIRVRHILIKTETGPGDDELTKEAMLSLKDRMEKGEDFATLAREYSDDPTTAPKGGELGWFVVSQIPPLFKDEIDSLEVKKPSNPVKTEFGYHLVTILERRQGGRLTLQDDWETIKEMARQHKSQTEFDAWLKELRANMHVDIRLEG